MQRSLRPLLWTALVLALLILGSSATLRLSANGIGCSPWPSCYGMVETANQVQGTSLIKALRLAHRLTATIFAVLALVVVAIGWRAWARPARLVSLVMLIVTVLLAWVGLYTPSPLPAVTVVNVLGGLALVGFTAALLTASKPPRVGPAPEGQFVRRALWGLLAILALQAAVGAMISARLAASACAVDCQQLRWSADAAALLHPLVVGRVDVLSSDTTAGQTLHWLHRILGAALLVVVSTMVYVRRARSGSALSWLTRALAATFSIGVVGAIWDGQLLTTIAHVLMAGLTAAALGAALIIALRPRADSP
ncbi:COX15/CtaA family protein [Rhodoferax sp.]|uniref:COX15/CtaA family protein n=1 Tax=Rhodoferax sp. TaxID=50421 RepID=UPI002758EA94|nr:COX15/CtaA family protein [Rhodoferax sp.]